jgi:hypothetical protein
MKATMSCLGVVLGLACPALLPAQCCYPCVPQAPNMCGPGFYTTDCYGVTYGPNYYVYPPFPPYNGAIPAKGCPSGKAPEGPPVNTLPYQPGQVRVNIYQQPGTAPVVGPDNVFNYGIPGVPGGYRPGNNYFNPYQTQGKPGPGYGGPGYGGPGSGYGGRGGYGAPGYGAPFGDNAPWMSNNAPWMRERFGPGEAWPNENFRPGGSGPGIGLGVNIGNGYPGNGDVYRGTPPYGSHFSGTGPYGGANGPLGGSNGPFNGNGTFGGGGGPYGGDGKGKVGGPESFPAHPCARSPRDYFMAD